jgi:hypothetical protein
MSHFFTGYGRKSLAPTAKNYRRGCTQEKECASIESKGFWQGERNEKNHATVVPGMVVSSTKEHL